MQINDTLTETELKTLLRQHSKTELLKSYLEGNSNPSPTIRRMLTQKPRRTLSGVAPITVLTKPYPCPGDCIFCPTDVKMPKSYLSSEPGAQRAANNLFDPYLQAYNRLQALYQMGHPVDKAELLVLGGTWSVYPEKYQIWFIKRLFDALNDFTGKDGQKEVTIHEIPSGESTWEELTASQKLNETSVTRCVGLVLETRPDYVTPHEIFRLRRLGATKIQIGIQSLDDQVLKLNKRGHSVKQTREALELLRLAGFKIHAHWMPNLYGSNPEKDQIDYLKLFNDPGFKPDELKIYPCSLIAGTPLVDIHQQGLWYPYTHPELLQVLSFCLVSTPRYCRLTRVIRDIPSQDILVGNKLTNFRQLAEANVKTQTMVEIRSREITNTPITKLLFKDTVYSTSVTTEHFLEYVTYEDKIAAFLRLSLPESDTAMIREVHVYGQATKIGAKGKGAQHQGLGKKLIAKALALAKKAGYKKVAVISAVGTREYYRKLGFTPGELYQYYEF